jgi:hypothetical protein
MEVTGGNIILPWNPRCLTCLAVLGMTVFAETLEPVLGHPAIVALAVESWSTYHCANKIEQHLPSATSCFITSARHLSFTSSLTFGSLKCWDVEVVIAFGSGFMSRDEFLTLEWDLPLGAVRDTCQGHGSFFPKASGIHSEYIL